MSKKKSSSFENGENYADAWKKYLAENVDEEDSLEEGFLDNLKTAFKAGSQAYKGAKAAGRVAGRDLTRATGGEVSSITQNLAGRTRDQDQPDTGSTTDAAADEKAPSSPPSTPVQLFAGDKALYSKLFSTIMSRFNNREIGGVAIRLDKSRVQNTVKQILKDLSAQLRANGMQVQEAHIPELVELVFEEIEKSQILEAQYTSTQTAGHGGGKTATGARVAPKQGQVDAGRAVGGKIIALVGQAAGTDMQDRELRKMVTADIQQDLKAIIMKVVRPHLQQYLRGTDINLREEKEIIDEEK